MDSILGGSVLSWALINHGTTTLLLIVAFFLWREFSDRRYKMRNDHTIEDKRYQRKEGCPTDNAYNVFVTKEVFDMKQKHTQETLHRIEETGNETKALLYQTVLKGKD